MLLAVAPRAGASAPQCGHVSAVRETGVLQSRQGFRPVIMSHLRLFFTHVPGSRRKQQRPLFTML